MSRRGKMSNFRFEQGAYVEIRMFVQGMVEIERIVEAEYPVDLANVPCLLGGEKIDACLSELVPVPVKMNS